MKLIPVVIIGIILGIMIYPSTPHLYVASRVIVEPKFTPTPTPTPKVDDLVDKYAKKYGMTTYKQNRTKVLLHFLLLREQNYGGSTNCGDGGKACGPLQFHEPTYIAYRKIMINRGLVTELGSRLDMENAIETAAWAINDGREGAWGPVARGEITL
jgi:hypothetical protein